MGDSNLSSKKESIFEELTFLIHTTGELMAAVTNTYQAVEIVEVSSYPLLEDQAIQDLLAVDVTLHQVNEMLAGACRSLEQYKNISAKGKANKPLSP